MEYIIINGELYHYGIKGQKWGIRRYQNEDGTLTDAGKKRYGEHGADYLKARSNYNKASRVANRARFVGGAAQTLLRASGHPIAGTMAKGLVSGVPELKEKKARDEFIRKRHDMLYETGRRKKLNGKYQTTGDDEVTYGWRGAKRIAKNQNKGLTREQAVRKENVRSAIKVIGGMAVSGLVLYDQVSGGKVTKAAVKGGLKAAVKVADGYRAVKRMYDNHYNTKILDVNGKVIARYHEVFTYGEDIAAKLLSA